MTDSPTAPTDVDPSPRLSPAARQWIQRGVVAAIWIGALIAWRQWQTSNDLSTTEAGQRFIDAIEGAWWGVAAFVGVYLIRPLVLFPASVITVMAGVLFGPWWGVAIVVVAANASAMVAYGVGRLLGRAPGEADDDSTADNSADDDVTAGDDTTGADDDMSSDSLAARWSNRLRENSFETVFIMRLIFLPYDLVNYLCGALRIRWAPFLLATALGSLPGTISFVLLGASLERIDQGLDGINPWAIVASVAIFVVSIVISRVVKRSRA
ncbi:MAG: VTT domain-containing protein [Actinomycetota bacterium]